MRFLPAVLRRHWLRFFKLHAIRENVVLGKNLHLGLGRSAAVLLLSAGGATVLGVQSNAQALSNHAPSASAAVASDDTAALEAAMSGAAPGATIIIPPGNYRVSRLAVKQDTTLFAPQGATIVGDLVAQGPNTVIRGFTFAPGMIDISNSQSVSIGDCVFQGGEIAIQFVTARNILLINNDFHRITAGAITGWDLDQSTISGNHFTECGQCITLDFNNDRTRGRNIVVERNIFVGTARMPLEVGPLGAYTENLIVRDNWAEDFKNRGPDPGSTMSTFVAFSIVPTHGVNTLIAGNYGIAGARGRGAIGIELAGSGEITRNFIRDFDYGAIVYGAGFNVHHNAFVDTSLAVVLNYAKRPGHIARNGPGQQMQTIARPPKRRVWPP
jgi:hypothetical protein